MWRLDAEWDEQHDKGREGWFRWRESGAGSEGINWDYFNWVGRPVNYRLR